MSELFANFYFLLFGMITVIAVVMTLAITWGVTRRSSAELDFKAKLFQGGMSADDIVRILGASGNPEARPKSPNATGVDSASLEEIVSLLGMNQASPDTIEQVLTAFRAVDEPTQQLMSLAVQSLNAGAEAERVDGEQFLAVVRPLSQPRAAANAHLVPIHDERIRADAQ